MSLLLPAMAASALWYTSAVAIDMKKRAQTLMENTDKETEGVTQAPYWAPTGHISNRFFADTRGRFTRMREDVDHLGAKIFLVDYGNGQEVIQYVDPRELL